MTTIVFVADDNYLPYVSCSLAQIARFGRRADGVVVCVPTEADDNIVAGVEAAADAHGVALKVVRVPEPAGLGAREVIYDKKHVSAFVFTKLRLAEILPDLDEVLCLDVDTLVRAPLDDLLDWELRHPLGAVIEIAGAGRHIFGTTRQAYFNGGVLRMSLQRMRQERTWDQAQLILERRGELVYQEQDVLNLLFRNRFDNIPLVFNVFESLMLANPTLDGLQDAVIVHFVGPVKPWHKSSKSRFAREWRQQYSKTQPPDNPPTPGPRVRALPTPRRRSAYTVSRELGRSRLSSLARATLPNTVKQSIKATAHSGLDRAADQIETLRTALRPDGLKPRKLPPVTTSSEDRSRRRATGGADHGLDLLISLPRSGANALGDAIDRSRPGVHWLCDLYWGASHGLRDGELDDRFPWFATGSPEFRDRLPQAERIASARNFAAAMNENAIEMTRAVLESREGRILIKVFPDQLHASVFEELLSVFRPRLLVLRRHMLFSYISLLGATDSKTSRISVRTDVPYAVRDTAALQYALRSDLWIDQVARLAAEHGLESTWLTYAGLFTTGDDIPLLESFYPGCPMPVDGRSPGLQSTFKVQDPCSDASVLGMVKAVTGLSTIAQNHLLRLPGHHVIIGDSGDRP